MAVFKCKMCGGDLEIQEGLTICECEYCGTKQTVPALDNEKKLNLFNRANRLRLNSEFDKAASIYENIIAEFPEEAEGYWGLVLCNYGIEYVDDPATARKIPTCHRAAFESVTKDENYELALEYADVVSQKVYRDEAREIDRIMSEILSISKNEKPYDIFICYKETDAVGGRTIDSVIAQDVYDALTDKGYSVFFSRISLEDKIGKQYEPYIFAALNSAKVMLAFGTKYEHFHAVWVKNEWSRFLKLMAKDKSKTLVPCYKDIDPYDMPDGFKALQAQDMGKVGAIQDLLRGIEKLLGRETKINSAVFSTVDGSALTTRGYIYLEDRDFKKADSYFDRALDENPMDSKAYVGKVLTVLKLSSLDELDAIEVDLRTFKDFDRALRFADGQEKIALEEIKEKAEKKYAYKKLVNAFVKYANKKERLEKQRKEAEARDFWIKDSELKKYRGSSAEVVIPNGVTSIGNEAFYECTQLSSVIIPDGVTSIGDRAFTKCRSLTDITIPDSVTSIGIAAFGYCESLKSLVIPERVTNIGAAAFGDCLGLESISISGSVTNIGEKSFTNCNRLTRIDVTESNSYYSSSDGVLFNKDKTTLLQYPASKADVEYIIPRSVIDIEDYAFYKCTKLNLVAIPDSVIKIGKSAFYNCIHLTSVSVSDNVTSLGDYAFQGCTSLKSITIPGGITCIGRQTFYECTGLSAVTIPYNVTSIADRAFAKCRSLTSITIPDSVTSIGVAAFGYCFGLETITIPGSVTSIGEEAFFGTPYNEKIKKEKQNALIEQEYNRALDLLKRNDDVSIKKAIEILGGIPNWKDSRMLSEKYKRILASQKTTQSAYSANSMRQQATPQSYGSQSITNHRKSQGLCQYCGGTFKGLFSKKCVKCGKPKDY